MINVLGEDRKKKKICKIYNCMKNFGKTYSAGSNSNSGDDSDSDSEGS